MKIKFTGFVDNTYKETKTTEVENVMGISVGADDCIVSVGYEDENQKTQSLYITSIQWAKGLEILP